MIRLLASELAHARRFCRDERGATAAEFALVVGVFMLLVFSTINFSLGMAAVIQIHYAAQKTARCISVDAAGSCDSPTKINTYAKQWYGGAGLNSLNFTATTPACGNKVVGTGTYPVFLGTDILNITLSSSACYPLI